MRTKNQILDALKSLAIRSGTTPGQGTFERETGIQRHEWHGKHGWRKWGDVVAEAGLEANSPPTRFSEDQLCEMLYLLAEELGRFPSMAVKSEKCWIFFRSAFPLRWVCRGRSEPRTPCRARP